MSPHPRTSVLLGLALVTAVASAPAQEKRRETFTATVLQTANMRLLGGGTFQLTMNVDEWTSVDERKRLLVRGDAAVHDGAPEADRRPGVEGQEEGEEVDVPAGFLFRS